MADWQIKEIVDVTRDGNFFVVRVTYIRDKEEMTQSLRVPNNPGAPAQQKLANAYLVILNTPVEVSVEDQLGDKFQRIKFALRDILKLGIPPEVITKTIEAYRDKVVAEANQ